MCIVIEGWSSRTIHKVNQARGIEDKIALYTFGGRGSRVVVLSTRVLLQARAESFFPDR